MSDLLSHPIQWKYFINLASTDFPIKTNAQIVRYLSRNSTQNEIESTPIIPGSVKEKRLSRYVVVALNHVVWTGLTNSPPPHGIGKFKGSMYNVLSRDFVDYAVNNETVKEIFEWSQHMFAPEEFLWAALIRFPGAPGYRSSNKELDTGPLQVCQIISARILKCVF